MMQPDDNKGIPYCTSTCPEYDGKRCRIMGFRPSSICEPAVEELRAENDRLRAERDSYARRIKALSILSCDPDEIEDPALDAFLGSWHPMTLGSNVCAYLDKTADALEAAGLLKEEPR